MNRKQALAAIWRDTHSDFKGTLDGARSIMVFRNGSTIVPLDQLTDAEIASRVKGFTPAPRNPCDGCGREIHPCMDCLCGDCQPATEATHG